MTRNEISARLQGLTKAGSGHTTTINDRVVTVWAARFELDTFGRKTGSGLLDFDAALAEIMGPVALASFEAAERVDCAEAQARYEIGGI